VLKSAALAGLLILLARHPFSSHESPVSSTQSA